MSVVSCFLNVNAHRNVMTFARSMLVCKQHFNQPNATGTSLAPARMCCLIPRMHAVNVINHQSLVEAVDGLGKVQS